MLLFPKTGVMAIAGQQLVMAATFDNPAPVHHQNAIGIANCG
jgi:hypothetical protein